MFLVSYLCCDTVLVHSKDLWFRNSVKVQELAPLTREQIMSIFVVDESSLGSVVHALAVDAGLCIWLLFIFILNLHFADVIIEWLKLNERCRGLTGLPAIPQHSAQKRPFTFYCTFLLNVQ